MKVGVHWDHRVDRWRSVIRQEGKNRHLGFFVREADARRAYDEAAQQTGGRNG